jgi:excisionase family DNA binding protein
MVKGPEGWITTKEATVLTGYKMAHIRNLARTGKIEAKRIGRDWLLDRGSVLAYKARMDVLGPQKHNPWREDLQTGGRRGEQDAE